MYISRIDWDDITSGEGSVEVTDSKYVLTCYAFGFHHCVGDSLIGNLESLDVDNIILSDSNQFSAECTAGFRYQVNGILCNNRKTVRIGDMYINIDPQKVPKDISDGDWISASIRRIDLWNCE